MRPIHLAAAALAVLLIQPPEPVQAQSRSSRAVYGGCLFAGRPVPSIASPGLDDIARAVLDPARGPLIFYNPGVLYDWSPAVQTFFYWHECAHHALGHTLGSSYPLAREQEADCWAIRELVRRRMFGRNQVAEVQDAMLRGAREDLTHAPAPVRAMALAACLRTGV